MGFKIMKYFAIAVLALLADQGLAMRIAAPGDYNIVQGGIKDKELMDRQASHWRKKWPEGAVDNSDNDAETIEEYNKPSSRKTPLDSYSSPRSKVYEPHTVSAADEFNGQESD